MSAGWLNCIKDIFHVTKFCFSSSASGSVQNHWRSPQTLTLVFADVVLPITLSARPQITLTLQMRRTVQCHTASLSMAQPGACHRGLPDPQILSPHRLKTVSFKTDTALACLFPSFFLSFIKLLSRNPKIPLRNITPEGTYPIETYNRLTRHFFVFYL